MIAFESFDDESTGNTDAINSSAIPLGKNAASSITKQL